MPASQATTSLSTLFPQVQPVAPSGAATFEGYSGRIRASTKLQAAVADIGKHLFPAMRSTPWWNEDEHRRCLWSSAATAEYLRRRRVRAKAVFGSVAVDVSSASGTLDWSDSSLGIGLPDPSTGHPGLHALVEIADRSGPWLLDVNVWQAQRPRFPGLPDIVAVSRDHDIELPAYTEFRLGGALPRDSAGHCVYLLTAPSRQRNWVDVGDMERRRAKTVADAIEARVRLEAGEPFPRNEAVDTAS